MRFLNQQVKEPHKKDLHILLDVIHEMKDRWAKNDAEKSRNERTALALSLLIDKYIIE